MCDMFAPLAPKLQSNDDAVFPSASGSPSTSNKRCACVCLEDEVYQLYLILGIHAFVCFGKYNFIAGSSKP